ncbi:uncharacterized protein LOC125236141 [Leguminivora glycinivorella]|uniref:uncharacterized protein LOC125236141 n=1 Tax=Leguminivora glycinivorella TaxID=1035111 RepID=UPI00200CDF55|nr:uncharacterized protein LOC125236141 [Leguminivora glycinivorella]
MPAVHTRLSPLAESLGREALDECTPCTHSCTSFEQRISATMDLETAAAVCLCAVSYYHYLHIYHKKKITKPWRKRRWWMITMHRKRTQTTMENQLAELVMEPSGQFHNFTRMSVTDFEYLLQKVSPLISKKDTPKRDAIPAKVRLAITLRFLASGDSFESLHFLFKVSSSIISRIVPEVCIALNAVLKDQIKLPQDPQSWLQLEISTLSGSYGWKTCRHAISCT